jgi:hypothetical protein
LWTQIDEDGMMRLTAMLPPEDAAVVMAALESITQSRPVLASTGAEDQDPAQDPALDPWAARRADALVSMCEEVLAGSQASSAPRAARQVVVHVDLGVLTQGSSEGVCFIDGGAPISSQTMRRIGCDAEVLAVTQRNGLPVDVGRKQRVPPDRLRAALEVRDRFCRFPGCGVPARRAQAHHIDHWADGGPTDRDNLILLCSFHHHRLHDGGYVIRKHRGEFSFETHDGRLIGSRAPAAAAMKMPAFEPETARAQWGGATIDFDHAVWALAHNIELAQARAAPPHTG